MTDQAIKLPEPEPEAYIWSPLMSRKKYLDFHLPDVECHYEPLYTADQLRQAVLEERSRMLRIVKEWLEDESKGNGDLLDAIRGGV
jgi:hypothetical protein